MVLLLVRRASCLFRCHSKTLGLCQVLHSSSVQQSTSLHSRCRLVSKRRQRSPAEHGSRSLHLSGLSCLLSSHSRSVVSCHMPCHVLYSSLVHFITLQLTLCVLVCRRTQRPLVQHRRHLLRIFVFHLSSYSQAAAGMTHASAFPGASSSSSQPSAAQPAGAHRCESVCVTKQVVDC